MKIRFILICCFLIAVICSFSQAQGMELTSEQKEKDFKFLTKLIRDVYPYAELNVRVKGLRNIIELEDEYLKRAVSTKNDHEFFEVFREYLMQLQCGYHAYVENLRSGKKAFDDPYPRYFFVGKPDFQKVSYWSQYEREFKRENYVHSDFNIVYKNGKYLLKGDYIISANEIIPTGAMITKIDDLAIDEYIKSLQAIIPLKYDPIYNKVYLEDPLVVNREKSTHWDVEFENKNKKYTAKIKKVFGKKSTFVFNPTIVCQELETNVGYIRIGNFSDDDSIYENTIKSFLIDAKGKYNKLIIDIRSNKGGTLRKGIDYIIEPLINKPLYYTETFALKKKLLNIFNLEKLPDLNDKYHFKEIKQIKPKPGFTEDEWSFYQVNREIKPQNSLPFKGKIYLLVDGYSYSAAEKFTDVVKQTKFAQVLGTRTGGGGVKVFLPVWCSLPESGILFRFEVDLSFNPDGTYNATYCTEPDTLLEPLPCPSSFEKEIITKDPWIKSILEN